MIAAPRDAIVIGAGIVGAACAAELASAGLRVMVVESGTVGGGTTAAGMGHLVVMDDSEAQFALTRLSLELWRGLAAEMPADAEYVENGTLWIAADEEEMIEVRRKHRFYGERGVATEVLDAKALTEAEPNLRPGLAGALLVPADGVLYPPCAARFLLERARVSRMPGEAVAITDGAVTLAGGERLEAEVVVNAAGTAAPRLTPAAHIFPRKGHLVITDRYPGFVRHQLVELGYLKSAHGHATESVAFNAQPRVTGQILLGSSRQYGASDARVETHILRRMLNRAIEYMPGLATLSAIRVWTGFRPSTPDNLPWIGKAPGSDHVWVAAGHEGLGITTSLGTGRLIADLVLGREPSIPAEPYSLLRNGSHG